MENAKGIQCIIGCGWVDDGGGFAAHSPGFRPISCFEVPQDYKEAVLILKEKLSELVISGKMKKPEASPNGRYCDVGNTLLICKFFSESAELQIIAEQWNGILTEYVRDIVISL